MKTLSLLALAGSILASLMLAGCSGGSTTVSSPDVQKVNARKEAKG